MNRSFFNVILGGFGATEEASLNLNKEQKPVKSGNADDAAFLMNASSVIIVQDTEWLLLKLNMR